MWFGTLILKNVIRRPLRSLLTVFAIAIAIGSVVSLVGISRGFEQSFVRLYEEVGVDLFVVNKSGMNPLSSTLDERLGDRIVQIEGVDEALSALTDMLSFQQYGVHSALVNGWAPQTKVWKHLKFTAGRELSREDTRAVVLGHVLATNMKKTIGDDIELLEGETFTIVGIYESFNVVENNFLIVPLLELQKVLNRPRQVNGYSIILHPSARARVDEIKARIQGLDRNLSVLPTRDHIRSNVQLQVVKAMAWLTSAIALLIGFFGIMNTMVMTVNERTKEIGILRAVGWRPRRVLRLILLEALTLSQVGALVGVIGSLALVYGLTRLPMVSGYVESKIQPELVASGFVVAGVVGLLGGLIPAWQAARMMPTAALRQE